MREETKEPKPLVIAHRGASGQRPEHTASAYKLAYEQGARAFEPDVVATRDGVLVIRHENEISSTTDVAEHADFADRKTTKTVDGVKLEGWFTEDFTWEELSKLRCIERLPKLRPANKKFDRNEPIMRLADLIELDASFGTEATVLVIEIKHAHYFESLGLPLDEILLEELKAAGVFDQPKKLIIESFELGVLQKLQKKGLKAPMVFLLESEGAPADEVALAPEPKTFEWFRSEPGLASLQGEVQGISVAKKDLFEHDANETVTRCNDLVGRAHALGLKIFTWTLRPENFFLNNAFKRAGKESDWGNWQEELELIVATDIDGVFADYPGAVLEALATMSGPQHKISTE